VILHRGGIDGFESAEAYMKRDLGGADALGCQRCKKFRGEMKTRRGGGDGDLSGSVCVNGLVSFNVARTLGGGIGTFDVGRERDIAETVGNIRDRLAGRSAESNQRGALGVFGENRAGEVVRVGKCCVDGQFFPGANEAPPCVVPVRCIGTEKQAFDYTTGGTAGMKAGGKDGSVISKESVPAAKKVGKVGEDVVSDGASGSIDDHETRGITTGCGGLCDEMRRQRIVEEMGRERHGRENEACDCRDGEFLPLFLCTPM
jgi:hypothetical protein